MHIKFDAPTHSGKWVDAGWSNIYDKQPQWKNWLDAKYRWENWLDVGFGVKKVFGVHILISNSKFGGLNFINLFFYDNDQKLIIIKIKICLCSSKTWYY